MGLVSSMRSGLSNFLWGRPIGPPLFCVFVFGSVLFEYLTLPRVSVPRSCCCVGVPLIENLSYFLLQVDWWWSTCTPLARHGPGMWSDGCGWSVSSLLGPVAVVGAALKRRPSCGCLAMRRPWCSTIYYSNLHTVHTIIFTLSHLLNTYFI